MSDPLFEEEKGATPLTEEERQQLILSYITLRSELNEAEQRNILEAEAWAFRLKRNVLSENFQKQLHKRIQNAGAGVYSTHAVATYVGAVEVSETSISLLMLLGLAWLGLAGLLLIRKIVELDRSVVYLMANRGADR